MIRDFKIEVPAEKIERLKQKLALTDLPDETEGVGWTRGAPLADIARLTQHWSTSYDWRATERHLNSFPNYMASIEVEGFGAVDVHFLHKQSAVKNAIPLLFVHGWPGSFIEVTKLLPLLTDNGAEGPSFHVVAPSLPNFGFSPAIKQPDFGIKQYSEVCHKLMLALGYDQYVSQGGDWGWIITRAMGKLYPSHLLASHLNLIGSAPPKPTSPLAFLTFLTKHLLNWYTPAEKAGLARTASIQASGMGYLRLQSTKPQTLGYSLSDSPAGLLAWIYEKLHDWTDAYPWTDDEICTWASLYWFSAAGPAASVRIYFEAFRGEITAGGIGAMWVPGVKLGLAYFPMEVVRVPREWGYGLGPVVYVSENERGGHFAAWEVPERVVGDLRVMFGKGGGAYGV
ncbi:alpha/beta-hydrolase, partial [Polyplosphaeria fusca]